MVLAFWVQLKYERLPNFCFACGIISHSGRYCPTVFGVPMVGGEQLFGPDLRAGGRSNMPPVNRWLVTEHSKGSSGDSNEQILECNGSISGMQSMKVNADINVVNDIPQPIVGGAFNATFNENKEGNEEEGVVFIDPKRRRVVGLDEVTTGPGLDVGPSMMEVQSESSSIGAGTAMQARQVL